MLFHSCLKEAYRWVKMQPIHLDWEKIACSIRYKHQTLQFLVKYFSQLIADHGALNIQTLQSDKQAEVLAFFQGIFTGTPMVKKLGFKLFLNYTKVHNNRVFSNFHKHNDWHVNYIIRKGSMTCLERNVPWRKLCSSQQVSVQSLSQCH